MNCQEMLLRSPILLGTTAHDCTTQLLLAIYTGTVITPGGHLMSSRTCFICLSVLDVHRCSCSACTCNLSGNVICRWRRSTCGCRSCACIKPGGAGISLLASISLLPLQGCSESRTGQLSNNDTYNTCLPSSWPDGLFELRVKIEVCYLVSVLNT